MTSESDTECSFRRLEIIGVFSCALNILFEKIDSIQLGELK